MESTFDLIFTMTVTANAPTAHASKPSLDPFEDLRTASGPVRLNYTARFQRSNIPFADFKRSDRRWLDLLLTDLSGIATASPVDRLIMDTKASVRDGFKRTQTWQDFIDDLLTDKVHKGMDITEGQIKHLPGLIALLSTGKKLAGCGSLEFYEIIGGKIL